VEEKLATTIESTVPTLGDIAAHLIEGGGKRVRPTVILLAFNAFNGQRKEEILEIATAIELIHAATLLHDDIIDGAEFRRGRQSAFKRFGLASTLVTGDFLFIKAFEFAGKFDETVVQWTANACTQLTEGEMLQGSLSRSETVTPEDYLDIVERKTASLFETGAKLGAYLAGATAEEIRIMGQYGLNLGIAFQMMDDVLDVVGRQDLLGKSIGMDLRDGNPSLPIVLSLLDGQKAVSQAFRCREPTESQIRRALDAMENGTVIDRARKFSRSYAVKACREIEKLPPSIYCRSLKALGRSIVERDA
jgi:octaprenyl-diphosphate synthase